jgi:hypothetical protein
MGSTLAPVIAQERAITRRSPRSALPLAATCERIRGAIERDAVRTRPPPRRPRFCEIEAAGAAALLAGQGRPYGREGIRAALSAARGLSLGGPRPTMESTLAPVIAAVARAIGSSSAPLMAAVARGDLGGRARRTLACVRCDRSADTSSRAAGKGPPYGREGIRAALSAARPPARTTRRPRPRQG